MKKHLLFKLLALFVVLITSVNTAWADQTLDNVYMDWYFNDVQFYTINGNAAYGYSSGDSRGDGVLYDLGILTTDFKIKSIYWKVSTNWNPDYCNGWMKYQINGGDVQSMNYNSDVGNGGNQEIGGDFNPNHTVATSSGTPGVYYFVHWFEAYFGHTNGTKYNTSTLSNSSKNYKFQYTIPGFTTTSTSQTFSNTTVGGESATIKISFGTHYGTALTTSNCSSLTDFTVTAIDESGVTVKFTPQTAGSKSETLTITDAHSKTCTITLTGKTKYTVTYNKGDNGSGDNKTADKIYGTGLTLRGSGDFTYTGYHQTAWNTNSAGTGGTSYSLGGSYTTEAAVTLYPTWTANSYTIAFNANDANYIGAATGSTASVNATYDEDCTLTTNGFSRAGYTFAGWNSQADGKGTNYTDGQDDVRNLTSTNGGSVTLYAKWTPEEYTITLNNQYSDGQGSDGTHEDDVDATHYVVTFGTNWFDHYMKDAPSHWGYTFCGYYSGSAGGGAGDQIITNLGFLVDGSSAYTNASGKWIEPDDVTVYAKWTVNQTLSKNTTDLGSSNGTITLTYKSSTVSGYTASERTGYTLDGYYTAATGGKMVIDNEGHIVTDEDVDGYVEDGKWIYEGVSAPYIYAHWTANGYHVAFDKDNISKYVYDATGSMETIDVTYDEDFTLPENTFERPNYTFNGWSKSSGGSWYCNDEATIIENLASSGTVTLYAIWLGDQHTVTFNPREGTMGGSNTANVRVGNTYGSGFGSGELPTPYAPSGYEFDGWYTSAKGGTKVEKTTVMTATSDHTLYAHYNKINRVYFKNTLGWENVYITYDAYWNSNGHGGSNDNGTGNYNRTYRKMTHLSGDVWYDNIPSGFLTTWAYFVAFNDRELLTDKEKHAPTTGDYENYNTGNVVFRKDFDSIASMFVPRNDPTNDVDGNYQKNGAQYISTGYHKNNGAGDEDPGYTSGYWRTYNDIFSGYELTYSVHSADSWTSKRLYAPTPSDSVFSYTLTLPANSQYDFAIYKKYGSNGKSDQWRIDDTKITSSNCTNRKLICEPRNSWFQTTVAGDYTIKVTMKKDGHMYLTIEYPFAVNDYRVVYNWEKGANSYSQVSEIIRCKAEEKDTISVFIHSKDSVKNSPSDTRSLYIQKCTSISAAGVPTWTNHSAITLPDTTKSGKTSGVYVFALEQNVGGTEATGSYVEPYKGKYYIRTAAADGGWDMYKYRSNNQMTYSAYSLTQTIAPPYSHYYCRFIESTSTDITYTIATDWSPSISDTLIGDALIGGAGNKTLPSAANVRFSWNRETNGLRRAYIKPAQGAGNERFLVLHGSNTNLLNSSGETIAAAGSGDNDLKANELQFNDGGNWVYELNLKAIPPTTVSLMARYGSTEQYLIGGASSYETIMGGSSAESNKYTITAKYDFKTNRLLTAWIPDGAIEDPLTDVDMIWVRHGNNAADQITFTGSGSLTNADVVGAIELRYDELVGHVASWTPSSRPLLKYFVSFPFDVNVSDVFGLNKAELNRDFKIQKYNGAKRASDGLFAGDGDTYWEDLTMDSVMHKYEGYCVMFDNDYLNGDKGDIWENKTGGSVVYLYFPAKKKVAAITSSDVDTIVPAHDCKIERTFSYGGGTISHKVADSNWNLIGPGLFQNSYVKTSSGAGDSDNTPTWSDNTKLGAYYEWSSYDNKWYIKPLDNSHKDQFKSMSAILVHWAGSITWSKDAPASYIAARRTPEKNNNTLITLELTYNDVVADKAIVKLQEEASSDFVLCEDVLKIINSGKPNIFVYAGDYSAAYSRVPVETQTIPVGVVTRANGTYTFSMPEGINGTVTLIDNFAQTRTNLSIEDYEVYLERGNIYDRFSIEIDVNNAPTAIDGVSGGEGQGTLKDGKAHKFIMNGQMYILENGKLYDVQGRRIE